MAEAVKAILLEKAFGEGAARTYAIRRVSFEAYWGEMLYVVGPSGSGKTTLLSLISGILKPDSGSVIVEGRDIWGLSPNEIADFRLHKVGFVFQDYHLFPKLTTVENVAIPLILKKEDWNRSMKVAMEFLEVVGLADKASLPPTKLSGGEQQRVAIARAIVGRPDLLVFDEPTASLDGVTGKRILDFVKNEILNDKRCIVVVTHDSRIFGLADRVIEMEDGTIVNVRSGGEIEG
ncbi:MAG: ABC transporter ATP-binding protein [Deltaproteobacteria bacterium]|jgi:putative ABC transport system ATP-binding protein|nr:ABC transporter ATP-binding protein [Deltaproteobacteria bacterium]